MRLFVAFLLLAAAWSVSLAATQPSTPEQAVLVQSDYGSKDWAPFFEFEKGLRLPLPTLGSATTTETNSR